MTIKLSFEQLIDLGRYEAVVEQLEDQPLVEEHIPLLTEAYLGLGELSKAETLINNWDVTDKPVGTKAQHQLYSNLLALERGEFKEVNSSITKLLADVGTHIPDIFLNKALVTQAEALHRMGRFQESLKKLEPLLEQRRSQKPEYPLLVAQACLIAGYVYWRNAGLKEANDLFREALSIYERIEDPRLIGVALDRIGLIYLELGNFPKAEEHFKRGLDMSRQGGNQREIANALTHNAWIYHDQGYLVKALELHQEALKIRKERKNAYEIGVSLEGIGLVYYNQRLFDKAYEKFLDAMNYHEPLGNPLSIAEKVVFIARVLLQNRTLDRNHPVIKKLPTEPKDSLILQALRSMVDGLFAQQEEDWEMAFEHWLKVRDVPDQVLLYQLFTHEHLIVVSLRLWMEDPLPEKLTELQTRLTDFETLCKRNHLLAYLTKINLIKAKIEELLFNFQEAEDILLLAISTSTEEDFSQHHSIAVNQLDLLREKQKLLDGGRLLKRQANLFEFQNYIQNILTYLP